MASSRLKNIIILILVLVNAFLLSSLLSRKNAEETNRHQADQQLVELFAADGVTLDPDLISPKTPPPTLVLPRNTQLDQKLAAFFLGEDSIVQDEGGGITSYKSQLGTALFRASGSFDMTGSLATGDAEDLCRKFCRTFGYSEPDFSWEEDGSGTATAVYFRDDYPVINCTLSFAVNSSGTLSTVIGTHLPDSYSSSDNTATLSARAALNNILETRRETGIVVSAIQEVFLCYELQTTTATPIILVPAWCIVTNTSTFYVNCSTGEVSYI